MKVIILQSRPFELLKSAKLVDYQIVWNLPFETINLEAWRKLDSLKLLRLFYSNFKSGSAHNEKRNRINTFVKVIQSIYPII